MKSVVVFLFIGIIFIGCSESIPEGPTQDMSSIFRANISTLDSVYTNPNNYTCFFEPWDTTNMELFFDQLIWRVTYHITVHNNLDEVIDGTRYVMLELKVWDKYRPEVVSTIYFADTTRQERYVLLPERQYKVLGNPEAAIRWDQCTDDGKFFFDFGPGGVHRESPNPVLASGRVKIFKEYDYVQTDTLEFYVDYLPTGQFYTIPDSLLDSMSVVFCVDEAAEKCQ